MHFTLFYILESGLKLVQVHLFTMSLHFKSGIHNHPIQRHIHNDNASIFMYHNITSSIY